jgi:hypothetical protein
MGVLEVNDTRETLLSFQTLKWHDLVEVLG